MSTIRSLRAIFHLVNMGMKHVYKAAVDYKNTQSVDAPRYEGRATPEEAYASLSQWIDSLGFSEDNPFSFSIGKRSDVPMTYGIYRDGRDFVTYYVRSDGKFLERYRGFGLDIAQTKFVDIVLDRIMRYGLISIDEQIERGYLVDPFRAAILGDNFDGLAVQRIYTPKSVDELLE